MRASAKSRLATLVLALVVMPPAFANGGMFRESGLKPGEVYEGRMLTVDELDACLEVESTLRTLDSEIDHAELSRSVQESRYRSLGHRISTEEQFLDTTDAKAVAHFNELVREHQQLIDAYNAEVEPINARIDRQAEATERFNSECLFGYYDSDLLKARSRRERRLAAQIEAEQRAATPAQ
jgi:hypothetical protein